MSDPGAKRQREIRKRLSSVKDGETFADAIAREYERETWARYRKAWGDLWAYGSNHGEQPLDEDAA